MKLRLKLLEEKSSKENFILTQEQARALESAKEEKIPHGECKLYFQAILEVKILTLWKP